MNPELRGLYESNPEVTKLIDMSLRLEGLPRHTSMHAAGVVISQKSVDEYVPLSRGSDGSVTTQFTMTTHGTVRVNSKVIGKDIDFPENMGVIIENPSFISHMSGLRNLEILAGYKKCVSKEQVKKIMELVNLDPESRLPVSKYSLGMKQRLGIAQAIMEKPKLLVLDEPFNGLDEDGVKEVRNILLKMKQTGVTIVLSSHNAEDIKILCNSVYQMNKGYMKQIL